jgi:Asp-tRNA(Asn)/Glu-tRNA(Gln) amidotransferase A subunit family amidase
MDSLANTVPCAAPPSHTLNGLGAVEAAAAIAEGRVTSVELIEACLARIDAVDRDVQAWTFLDPELARAQARAADAARRSGQPLGALHGVPVAIKDVIDTADMPTENGTPLHACRQPRRDATVVSLLRAAGAVIMGKTVTTELAAYSPGKTRNPHDPERTPGGSSSGSAAAVAAEMVPLALGTQTNGSVIRPASYCGVVGYKPTHGLISRAGILRLSRLLDHVGVFARAAGCSQAGAGADGLRRCGSRSKTTRSVDAGRFRRPRSVATTAVRLRQNADVGPGVGRRSTRVRRALRVAGRLRD